MYENILKSSDPKIYITRNVLESEAFRSLSRASILVYLDFLSKRILKEIKKGYRSKRKPTWEIENNGNLIYPYREAEKNGHSRKQFRNAIDELQAKGLIDITHFGKGGKMVRGQKGDATRYLLDNRWEKYDTEDMSKFKPARKLRKKDNRRDRGWKLFNAKKKGAGLRVVGGKESLKMVSKRAPVRKTSKTGLSGRLKGKSFQELALLAN